MVGWDRIGSSGMECGVAGEKVVKGWGEGGEGGGGVG